MLLEITRCLINFPQNCLLCGFTHSSDVLCAACAADLPRLTGNKCPRCALPTPQGEICSTCQLSPPLYSSISVPFRYDYPIDRLVHALKYGGRLSVAHWLGKQISQLLAKQENCAQIDYVITMPLHIERLKERGYNQAAEIGRTIARELNKPLRLDCCARLRSTAPQTRLPHAQRQKNVQGAFSCTGNGMALRGKRILLVDDVITTGASLNECARALLQGGATEVSTALAARTVLR